jgi:tetratricopeptide (TPR) repeat protein
MLVMLNLFQQLSFAQNVKIDSLLNVLKTAKEDTNKVNTLNELSKKLWQTGNFDSAFIHAENAKKLSVKLNSKKGIAIACNSIGVIYFYQGNYPKALDNHFTSLEIKEDIGDKKGVAASYSNIAMVYENQGKYPEALKNYFAALKIREEIGDNIGLVNSYNNIGGFYYNRSNYTEALKNLFAALKIGEKIGEKKGTAFSYNNIGMVYDEQGNYPEALRNYFASLKIRKEIGDQQGVANSYNFIGLIYYDQGNYQIALQYLFDGLNIYQEIGDKNGIADAYGHIGNVFTRQKKYKEAEENFIKGRNLSKEIGHKEYLKNSYSSFAVLDSAQGNYRQALEHYKLYTQYKDSLLNEDNNKQIAQMKTIYETEKKDAEITLLNKDKEIQEKEITKQKLVRNGFVGGFGLTLLLAGSIFFSLQQNKKKNKIITAQKIEVEEKNRHITDSITYALRIQTAILPPDKLVREYLSNSFVLYLPKDIVAGDFYWMETLDNVVLFAACDCTGHGVPGAIVSVMCHNALNRSVREYGLTQPAQILDKVLEIVQDNFAKSENDIQDGMDASVCAYYPNERKLQWSGAQNPLWIIRDNTIIEYKPDKQSIGKHEEISNYTNHEISLQPGDSIYVFSDGYADQFDTTGEEKLTKKGFKNILLSMQDKTMEQQREELKKLHIQRMGSIEQTDDVCVIGVRV